MAKTNKNKQKLDDVAQTLISKAPLAVDRLCKILEDDEVSASTALSAVKEVLERTMGKGCVISQDECAEPPVNQFIFKLEVIE